MVEGRRTMKKEDGSELLLLPLLGYKPLIGVIHLPPISFKRGGFNLDRLIEYALEEAGKLEEAGFSAVLLENYGDAPYHIRVDISDAIAMSVIAREVARSISIPVGISLLRNSGIEGLLAALQSGARFVRVNAYCEVRVAPEGILTPIGAQLEDIRYLTFRSVLVLADVDVKHSAPLAERELVEVVRDCVTRGKPDAIIVSSSATGLEPEPGYVAAVKSYARGKPVIIGSGISIENIETYWNIADGFIVGTSIKLNRKTMNPVDKALARELAEKVNNLRMRDFKRLGVEF